MASIDAVPCLALHWAIGDWFCIESEKQNNKQIRGIEIDFVREKPVLWNIAGLVVHSRLEPLNMQVICSHRHIGTPSEAKYIFLLINFFFRFCFSFHFLEWCHRCPLCSCN